MNHLNINYPFTAITMSLITVCIEHEKTKTVRTYDENNVEHCDEIKIVEYIPQNNEKVFVQTDFMGNIYLKHGDQYYTVSLDSYQPSGVELNLINKPDIFRMNLVESKYLRDAVKSGVIKANSSSLAGKAYESMTDMTEEDMDEYMSKNNFSNFDTSFHEKKYYWIQYKEEDEPMEEEENDEFYLNGISEGSQPGIMYSDLLSYSSGSFDTIMIQGDTASKNVVSTTERIDGYCVARLTIYTSGHLRSNFMDSSKLSRLCVEQKPKEGNPETMIASLVVKKIRNE